MVIFPNDLFSYQNFINLIQDNWLDIDPDNLQSEHDLG